MTAPQTIMLPIYSTFHGIEAFPSIHESCMLILSKFFLTKIYKGLSLPSWFPFFSQTRLHFNFLLQHNFDEKVETHKQHTCNIPDVSRLLFRACNCTYRVVRVSRFFGISERTGGEGLRSDGHEMANHPLNRSSSHQGPKLHIKDRISYCLDIFLKELCR